MDGKICITNRETLTMSNVREVLSFDTDFVCVLTDDGKVEIEGDGMRIVNMSSESGDMLLIGRIDGVFYAKPPKKKGFLSK
ncbi:MAG: YabP/YqfC family sporulation protein [Clostridia bacterium]|nr:YabP/YqfC family sporulation protein [Clostridia bacterium]